MAGSAVTQIDTDYLNKLKAQLEQLESQVEGQLAGMGPSSIPGTTNFINPVNDLTLLAGASGFDAGAAITSALKTAGDSVADQMQWLDKVVKDMITEVTNTVNSFQGTESLNNAAVDTLINEFQQTINDMNNPPGSSSSNPNTPAAS